MGGTECHGGDHSKQSNLIRMISSPEGLYLSMMEGMPQHDSRLGVLRTPKHEQSSGSSLGTLCLFGVGQIPRNKMAELGILRIDFLLSLDISYLSTPIIPLIQHYTPSYIVNISNEEPLACTHRIPLDSLFLVNK